ncbi:MAG: hypothetical protein U0L12_03150 [Ruminococcus sp.]|nr:hypothetical protein [Ruminococcus sp.]
MKNADKDVVQKNNDHQQIQTWHCDTYCRKVRHVTCEGQENVREDAPDLCPYFDEMLY